MSRKRVFDQTVSEVRDEQGAIHEIAKVTGLDAEQVQWRLEQTHGKSLVWTAFAPELMDPADLAEQTVAYARTYQLATRLKDIANISLRTARNKLNQSHGKLLLKNLFDFGIENEVSTQGEEKIDLEALLNQTVSYVRDHDLAHSISQLTGLSKREINLRLDDAHGKTLVRNLFEDVLEETTSRVQDEEEVPGAEKGQLVSGMGGPQHRRLQDHLAKLGRLRNLHVRTDWPIGAGFKPDVLWFGLDPDKEQRAGAKVVFEIEFGQANSISKSLSSLKHAHDLWPNAQLVMIVPERSRPSVEKKLPGAFHEIAESLYLVNVEDCRNAKDLYDLAVIVKAVRDERE